MNLKKITLDAFQRKDRSIVLLKVKLVLMACCFAFIAANSHAQMLPAHQPVRVNPAKDKIEYQGFAIRLIPGIDFYYGYDIFKDGKLVHQQIKSPLPDKPLANRDDAFAAAERAIGEYLKTGRYPSMFAPAITKQTLPSPLPKTAKQ